MKPKISPEVSWREVEDEIVVLHLKSGSYYSLNEAGKYIWKQCSGNKSLLQIERSVAKKYDLSSEKARVDVDKLFSHLLKENLITVSA